MWILRESDAEAECYQVMKPVTQQRSVLETSVEAIPRQECSGEDK
jgi:hypothetical protein